MLSSLIAVCVAYTNVAGKVIVAEPVKIVGNKVTFQGCTPTTRTCTYNLSLFPPSEQRRIKAALGVEEPPPELKGLWEEISTQRRRAEARHKAGRMTDAELSEYLENLEGSWRHAKLRYSAECPVSH